MISLRELLARHRKRLLVVAVLGTLALAVAVGHSGLGHDQPEADGMGGLVSMCLAVAETAGVVLLGGLAAFVAARGRERPIAALVPAASAWIDRPPLPVPRTRAGPALLSVFRR